MLEQQGKNRQFEQSFADLTNEKNQLGFLN